MLGKREAWIYRAAAATACGILLFAIFTVLWVWLFREAREIAPEWMTEYGRNPLQRRGRGIFIEDAFYFGWLILTPVLGLPAALGLFRLWRVPLANFLPGGVADYPFRRRPKSLGEMTKGETPWSDDLKQRPRVPPWPPRQS